MAAAGEAPCQVLHAGWAPHDVAGAQFLNRLAPLLRPPDARHDHQPLPCRVGMPRRARTRLERDIGPARRDLRGGGPELFDPYAAGESRLRAHHGGGGACANHLRPVDRFGGASRGLRDDETVPMSRCRRRSTELLVSMPEAPTEDGSGLRRWGNLGGTRANDPPMANDASPTCKPSWWWRESAASPVRPGATAYRARP